MGMQMTSKRSSILSSKLPAAVLPRCRAFRHHHVNPIPLQPLRIYWWVDSRPDEWRGPGLQWVKGGMSICCMSALVTNGLATRTARDIVTWRARLGGRGERHHMLDHRGLVLEFIHSLFFLCFGRSLRITSGRGRAWCDALSLPKGDNTATRSVLKHPCFLVLMDDTL